MYKTSITHEEKLMKYIVICTLYNGNVITASANSFSVAMLIADKFISGDFTKRVEIVKISTGATTRYIY